jgi:hypothetical protein
MTRNMGTADKIIRIVLGALFLVLWMMGMTKGALAIILGIVGIVFILTSVVSFCPLYALFGFRTCPLEKKA